MSFPTWADVLTELLESILDDTRLNDPVHFVRGTERDLGAHLRLRAEDLARQISSADCEAIATGLIERATKPTRRQAPRGLVRRDER